MIALLADVNIEGHVACLGAHMQADYWRDVWDHLEIRSLRFGDVGLSPDATDAQVWRTCQSQQLLLLTHNRNEDGPDSLAATIRTFNTVTSLPVFTVSIADRILQSKDYAERVVETLYDYLLRIDSLRGSGRLFLP